MQKFIKKYRMKEGNNMSYYLMVQTKKGEYLPLDITKSTCFTRMSKSRGMNCTLKEIDIFTTMFYNEQELKEMFIKEGILLPEYAYKELSIRRLTKGKYEKVMYDFLYQKDIEYIMEPKKIINKINNKLQNEDFRFIEELTNHYYKYHDCSSTLPEVREYISTSIRLEYKDLRFNKRDENNDNILVRMLKLLIYEYNQGRSGKIQYTDKIKYANLHSLIAFTNNYEQKFKNDLASDEQLSLFKEIDNPKKKQKVIPGQFCLTDIIK